MKSLQKSAILRFRNGVVLYVKCQNFEVTIAESPIPARNPNLHVRILALIVGKSGIEDSVVGTT